MPIACGCDDSRTELILGFRGKEKEIFISDRMAM